MSRSRRAILSAEEIARRVPVWAALSELFLDTELTAADYDRIRGGLAASGYPPPELRRILAEEVAPAFAANLFSTAGEWAGWQDDHVEHVMLEHLDLRRCALVGRFRAWLLRPYLTRKWRRIDPTGLSVDRLRR